MKRWAVITVLLYVTALVALTAPAYISSFSWGSVSNRIEPANAIKLYAEWGYWIYIAVAAIGQFLLLAVPVSVAERRPISRRRVCVPIVTSAFLLGLMTLSLITSLSVAVAGDDALEIYFVKRAAWPPYMALVVYLGVFWTFWGVVFLQFFNKSYPQALSHRLTRWLLAGSVLDLLVAVPSHVIVRRRDDCCAPAATFWGIATGLTIMLMSFGPGVYFLFAERARRLRPRTA